MYASLYKNILRFVLKESNEGESRISHGTKFHRVGPAFGTITKTQKTFYVCLEHEEALVRPISKRLYYFVYKSTCYKYIWEPIHAELYKPTVRS
jgi:hypothetical protein